MNNTKQLGLLGELKAQFDFIEQGFDVSIPQGDYCAYDFLACKNGKIYKIQVKSCEKIKDGKMQFDLSSRNYYVDKQYTNEEVDYFYLFCLENKQGYLYKLESSSNIRGIYLRIEPPRNNQVKGINFAKDFEFNKKIQEIEG